MSLPLDARVEIIGLVREAVGSGARRKMACETLELELRTLERWELDQERGDGRSQSDLPRPRPVNQFTSQELERIVTIATSREFRDLPPTQIVPRLADRGEYAGSESSFYRVLHARDLMGHRGKVRAPHERHRPQGFVATAPCQVFSWDITYLKSEVRGVYFYLYLFLDVFSRKIVGWDVYPAESADLAARLFEKICRYEGLDPKGLVLHADNGGPMKGATMLATLQRLGVVKSFSRASVSDDNPYSEALFRTLKYRPGFPSKPFKSVDEARAWIEGFVRWYNTEHLHSEIGFTTPDSRHRGLDVEILARRHEVYLAARKRHPVRWSGATRDWTRIDSVALNPACREKKPSRDLTDQAE